MDPAATISVHGLVVNVASADIVGMLGDWVAYAFSVVIEDKS